MTVKTYSARDLRDSKFLTDDSLSIITSHGKPVKVTIPFNDIMFNEGISRSLALNLVENHLITQVQGARMANMPLESFLELMAEFKIPVVNQTKKEVYNEWSISLALENKESALLIDEAKGREIARHLDVPVIGLTGLLLLAKKKNMISAVMPLLIEIRDNGYCLSDKFLKDISELSHEDYWD